MDEDCDELSHAIAIVNRNSQNYGAQITGGQITNLNIYHAHQEQSPDEDRDRKKVLIKSLEFSGMGSRRYGIENETSGTCQWLLEMAGWQKWQESWKETENTHPHLLWIKGKPGSGKSTLMKFAVHHQEAHSSVEGIVLSHFFDARGTKLQQSTQGLYRWLLVQLLRELPTATIEGIVSSDELEENEDWILPRLERLLESILEKLDTRPITIFVDALDECDTREAMDMVRLFKGLCNDSRQKRTSFRVCFASRHYPNIVVPEGQSLQFKIEDAPGHKRDIKLFIEDRLSFTDGNVADRLKEELYRKADGVFIYVKLIAGVLEAELSDGRLYQIAARLQDLPDDLSELYADLLTRDNKNLKETLTCIQMVLFSPRPLETAEVWWAIHLGAMTEPSDDDLIQLREAFETSTKEAIGRFVLGASKGLVEYDLGQEQLKLDDSDAGISWTESKLQSVRFIHETVRDFLLKSGQGRKTGLEMLSELGPENNVEARSHQQLSRICGLQLSASAGPIAVPRAPLQGRGSMMPEPVRLRTPFLWYAHDGVMYHANKAQELGLTQSEFLRDFKTREWAKATIQLAPKLELDEDHRLFTMVLLEVLLYCDAPELISQLIADGPMSNNAVDVLVLAFAIGQDLPNYTWHRRGERSHAVRLKLFDLISSLS